ncbi:putative pectinesterase/pectinesterase inhibitor 51 [Ananas comosus]|uniref:Pectinesterase n=1 Tax=Ananas comosus TaxID=4615 RepID=A0A199VGA7_ANACO|nr:putative pectinesterase/pectinesterase inhibitor 51 [Ananas comosus]
MALLLLLLFTNIFTISSSSSSSSHHHHHHQTLPPSPPSSPTAPSASTSPSLQILLACNATRFPSICVSSLSSSSSSSSTAPDIISAAVSAAAAALPAAVSAAKDILAASAASVNRSSAARNCLELLSLSSRRLSSVSLPPSSLPAARAMASAALLYQYDCWSAYKYVNDSRQVDAAMAFLADNLTALTSNAASMLAALHRFGPDLSRWAPPQTERDGYWPGATHQFRVNSIQGGVPTGLKPNVTVCKGRGLRKAIQAAPDFGAGRFVVYAKEGVYEETVRVPFEKTKVVLVGDGMGKTVITGSLNVGTPGIWTYNTATVAVLGDGFMARDLTIANTAGPDKHQAVAFRSDSDLSVIDSVEFLGHQDTLYAHGLRQFYTNCRISGTVDFIFGNSAAVFSNCLIIVLPRQVNPEHGESNTLTAHGRTDPAQSTGFVFDHCVANGSDDYLALYRKNPSVHRVYLGRPWKEYSRTVFLNCYLPEIIRPEGWLPFNGDFALKTLYYGEYQSTGPGGQVGGRVPWSSQVPAEHVAVYSVDNFIQGDQWIPT